MRKQLEVATGGCLRMAAWQHRQKSSKLDHLLDESCMAKQTSMHVAQSTFVGGIAFFQKSTRHPFQKR